MKTKTNNAFQNDIFTNRLYKYYEIKNKPIRRWIFKRKTKKFCKNIMKSSPCFETLWDMALFIKNAEKSFFYSNDVEKIDDKIGLYSSKNFPAKQNGFKVTTTICQIILKLYIENDGNKRLALEIENRMSGVKTNFVFVNNEWACDHSVNDEILLEQVIQIINTQIINLFNFCWAKL